MLHGVITRPAPYKPHAHWVNNNGEKLPASLPPIDIVTQEEVVYVCDVASCVGCTILLKQPHEVTELAMQVAKDLDGGLYTPAATGGQEGLVSNHPVGLGTMLGQSTMIPLARQPLSAAPHRWLQLLVVRKWLLLLVREAWRSRSDNYLIDLKSGVCHSL
jgi:hypothetical protein